MDVVTDASRPWSATDWGAANVWDRAWTIIQLNASSIKSSYAVNILITSNKMPEWINRFWSSYVGCTYLGFTHVPCLGSYLHTLSPVAWACNIDLETIYEGLHLRIEWWKLEAVSHELSLMMMYMGNWLTPLDLSGAPGEQERWEKRAEMMRPWEVFWRRFAFRKS